MSEKKVDSIQDLSFAELKEIAGILKAAPNLRTFSLKFRNLELAIESGLNNTSGTLAPTTHESLEGPPPLALQADAGNHPAGPSHLEHKPADHSLDSSSSKTQNQSRVTPDPDHFVVRSPMVGTYYKASQPGAKPFVAVGEEVKKGEVVCLIEVMKLINSVVTDVNGRVAAIHVEDAQAVEYGQPLISIKRH